jgi:hypothetical protein
MRIPLPFAPLRIVIHIGDEPDPRFIRRACGFKLGNQLAKLGHKVEITQVDGDRDEVRRNPRLRVV